MKQQKIIKVTEIEDLSNGDHIEVYRFERKDGSHRNIEIKPSDARDTRLFVKKLWDQGASLPESDKDAIKLVANAVTQPAKKKRVYAKKTGWINKHRGFVRLDGHYGNAKDVIGINASKIKDSRGRLTTSGNAQSWSDSVGELARNSSSMMTAVCAAFAAPLLSLQKMQSFSICLYGRSRAGKSMSTLAAASVSGGSEIQNLLSWNITDAALEERLPEFNDCLFAIDDLMNIAEKDRYSRLRVLAYVIAEGQTKRRHTSFQSEKKNRNWRTILLTTSEFSVRDLANEASKTRLGGEAIRLIDVPAVHEPAMHIFDRNAEAEETTFRSSLFGEIAKACRENHGAVFKVYIEKLIELGFERAKEAIDLRVSRFRSLDTRRTDQLALDISDKFSLLYAAGSLAIKFKLLTWKDSELIDALTKSLKGAQEILPRPNESEIRCLDPLETFLETLPSKKEAREAGFDNVDGYRTKSSGHLSFMVKREALIAVFNSKIQRNLRLQEMIRNGRIKRSKSSKDLPKIQFTWPDQKRRRSYLISSGSHF